MQNHTLKCFKLCYRLQESAKRIVMKANINKYRNLMNGINKINKIECTAILIALCPL